jgi:predicted lipoprotein with Yx(FWY)xxD motif
MATLITSPVPGRFARRTALLAGLGAAALLTAACGSSSTGTPASTGGGAGGGGGGYGQAPASSNAAPATQAAAISARAASLGDILVGPNGHSVYLFEKDAGTTSSCSGACATAWPPVTTSGAPTATGAVQAAQLGTTQRSDGTSQVTYAGHPLYYFVGDRAASDVRGQGLKNFGAGWYVVSPAGQKIDKD